VSAVTATTSQRHCVVDTRNARLAELEAVIRGGPPRADHAAWVRSSAAARTGLTCGECSRSLADDADIYAVRWGRGRRGHHQTLVCPRCAKTRYVGQLADVRYEWVARACAQCGRNVHRRYRYGRGFVSIPRCCSARCGRRRQAAERRKAKPGTTTRCAACGETFTPTRADAVTCSNACRQRAYRQRQRAP